MNQARMVIEPEFRIFDAAVVHGKDNLKIRIYLDKLNDPWGTPSIEDCARFSRSLDAKLMELAANGKIPDNYSLEVASPGAERELRGPEEWLRFQGKPMKVRYTVEREKMATAILDFIGREEDKTFWKKAELKKGKNAKKGKKKATEKNLEVMILLNDISQVKLYLDF